MRALVIPMPPAQLQALDLLLCPRCGDMTPLDSHFCCMCSYLVNPARYFWWLANQQKK